MLKHKSFDAIRRWRKKKFGSKSNEIFVFLFFLAVSFSFWLLQALNETVDRDVQVTVSLVGVPDDIVILDSIPQTIGVTIRDKGLTLARHSIYTFFRPTNIKLDFKRYSSQKDYDDIAIQPYELQRLLSKQFNASTRIQSINPDTLHLVYNHGRSRMLPIRLNTSLRTLPQNYIQSVTTKFDSVRVYAPSACLDTMQAAYTEPLEAVDLDATAIMTAVMKRLPHVKYQQTMVPVKVNVGYYTEKSFSVAVIGTNFPADKKLRTFPARVNVTFRVESGRYQQIGPSDFVLTTTYEELIESPANKLLLQLKDVPQGVYDVRISPMEVDYLIEQNTESEQ